MSFPAAIGTSLGSSLGSATGAALAPQVAAIWGPYGTPTTLAARYEIAIAEQEIARKKAAKFPWAAIGVGFTATVVLVIMIEHSEANKRKRQPRPAISNSRDFS